jgi:hypothetical protein
MDATIPPNILTIPLPPQNRTPLVYEEKQKSNLNLQNSNLHFLQEQLITIPSWLFQHVNVEIIFTLSDFYGSKLVKW